MIPLFFPSPSTPFTSSWHSIDLLFMFEGDSFSDPSEALKIKIEMIKNLNIWKFYFLLFGLQCFG